jgi:hypothetical protein
MGNFNTTTASCLRFVYTKGIPASFVNHPLCLNINPNNPGKPFKLSPCNVAI